MAARDRINRLALAALAVSLALAVLGRVLAAFGGAPFWGGLLAAFGEASLVGGLADWFAVRALFAHPFGIPFPHTALIPRNRTRIIHEIRDLVLKEWLPASLLRSKLEAFDYVGSGLMPVLGPLRAHLRRLLQSVGQELLAAADLRPAAALLAKGLADAASGERAAPVLADLARRAREQRWLEPVLEELVRRLREWIDAPDSKRMIRWRLGQAATSYRDRHPVKDVAFFVGQLVGAIDLDGAAEVVQHELRRFAAEQLAPESKVQGLLADGLTHVEERLRDDPAYLDSVRGALGDPANLARLLEPVLASLRQEALLQVGAEESPWVALAMAQADGWVARLRADAALREQVNAWCRRVLVQQLEQHHNLLGVLVEEQMNRLSQENLAALIQARVGEDLNWIRLNGTFVGGLIGVVLYLLGVALHLAR
jgi:uncharacterized membrane-anchored protein YjiN (DUF445 family)